MITTLRLSKLGTVYLIKGENGYLMVDTPENHKCLNKFLAILKSMDISLKDIKYIFLTHSHIDHGATISEIQKLHPIPVIFHRKCMDLFTSHKVLPNISQTIYSSRKFVAVVLKILSRFMNQQTYPLPLLNKEKDIIIDKENLTVLRQMGIPADIYATPGHSDDSISIVFDSGDAIVGDLVTGLFTTPFPFIFTDIEKVKHSWEKLFDLNAERIHFSHSGVISVDRLRNRLKRQIKSFKVDFNFSKIE